ncbi:MAG: DNA-binding response regulator [Bacteroidetes bacterium]|nr:MAG: DNA-binding response regulator [Bacteroidota bacterium]
MLKAILIDDEKIARETLEAYLKKYCPKIEILALCENIQKGLIAIELHQPDVVFLDVEMPFGNAFDLLEQCKNINFETIFVTAFSHYALKALNQSASYYLLKPIDITELIKAVDKIADAKEKKNWNNSHTQLLVENLKTTQKTKHKIALPLLEGFEFVQIQDIIRCQANDNFTDVILKDGRKLMICRTLKFYEELLSENGFVRIHKSHLVNIAFAIRYLKGKGGQLEMFDKSVLDVSPTKKQELLAFFNSI